MANELGQPTAQEIAEKFCTEMLCNALLCDGCPVQAILHAAQQGVQRIGGDAPLEDSPFETGIRRGAVVLPPANR